jgi:two-component system phosphate regulon sensor histidine kinase PhoR
MRKRGQGDPAALDVIDRQTERLARMVQQLLEVSRFRAGGSELEPERFDLAGLVAEAAAAVAAQTEGRRILVAPAAPAAVLADRARIGQVVTSLFANAVRFSPEGGDVEAAVGRQGQEVVVWVRDHGLGIPADRRARIFERYYRAHAGTAHDYGGLGLGLDMSREIVARHGGRIWFESEEGRGSTFSFSLPVAPEERAAP